MKVKYIGASVGVDGLTNGQEYVCLGIEDDFLRIIDDSGEDYLYPIDNPVALNGGSGRWLIVEDTDSNILHFAMDKHTNHAIPRAV